MVRSGGGAIGIAGLEAARSEASFCIEAPYAS
jgi:hypothetical protein